MHSLICAHICCTNIGIESLPSFIFILLVVCLYIYQVTACSYSLSVIFLSFSMKMPGY